MSPTKKLLLPRGQEHVGADDDIEAHRKDSNAQRSYTPPPSPAGADDDSEVRSDTTNLGHAGADNRKGLEIMNFISPHTVYQNLGVALRHVARNQHWRMNVWLVILLWALMCFAVLYAELAFGLHVELPTATRCMVVTGVSHVVMAMWQKIEKIIQFKKQCRKITNAPQEEVTMEAARKLRKICNWSVMDSVLLGCAQEFLHDLATDATVAAV